jgi:hypothetical protein
MLVTPTVAPLYRNKGKGVVQQNGRCGYVQRRLSYPVQSASKLQVNWRQNFATAKYGFASLGAKGANSADVNGVAPQTAWENENNNYRGILEAGKSVNDVTGEGILINCAGEEAYYTKIQAVRSAMSLAARPTPGTSLNLLTPPTSKSWFTISGGYLHFVPQTAVQTNPQDIVFIFGFDGESSSQVDAAGNILSTPSGLKITQLSSAHEWYNPATGLYEYAAALYIAEIDPSVAAGTYSVQISVNYGLTVGYDTLDFVVTQPSTRPAITMPSFAIPTKLSCNSILDDDLKLAFFSLKVTWEQSNSYPVFTNTKQVPSLILVTASDVYTSGYSPPDESEWTPTLYLLASGSNYYITPEEYEAVHGTISDSGHIKFMVQAIDPCTGCPGPAISCTATWDKGTFNGTSISNWSGNGWTVNANVSGSPIDAPGTATVSITVTPAVNSNNDKWPGSYTFPRTFSLSLKSSTIIPTGASNTKRKLPSDLTFTTSPSSLTFNHQTDGPQTVTVTVKATANSAGTYSYDPGTTNPVTYALRLKADDNVYAVYGRFYISVRNTAVALPPWNYLTMTATAFSPSLTADTTSTTTITLSNEGSDDISVSMLSEVWGTFLKNQDLLIATPPDVSFDNQNVTVPGGTHASPGTATVVATVTIAAGIDTADLFIHFQASAGSNTADIYVD